MQIDFPLHKTIINNSSIDPNKILPMKYKWAREHYKKGVANNWVPEEVNMQQDIAVWRSRDELSRFAVCRSLSSGFRNHKNDAK